MEHFLARLERVIRNLWNQPALTNFNGKTYTHQQVAMEICRRMSYKFTPDNEYIEEEIRRAGSETLVLELCIEYITGKTVEES